MKVTYRRSSHVGGSIISRVSFQVGGVIGIGNPWVGGGAGFGKYTSGQQLFHFVDVMRAKVKSEPVEFQGDIRCSW